MSKNISFFDNKITSFFCRVLVLFLSIIIVFNTVCKPHKVDAAVVGGLTIAEIVSIIGAISGIATTGVTCYRAYKDYTGSDASEEEFAEYFNQQITVDGDGNYIISDDGMVTINGMKEAYENEVTYQNMYLPTAEDIPASEFTTKEAYSKFYTLVKNNPGYVFAFSAASHTYNSYSNVHGWTIRVHDADITGVSSEISSGMGRIGVYVYDNQWQSNFSWTEFYLCDDVSNSKLVYKDSEGNWVELETVDEVSDFDFSLATNTYTGGATTKFGSSRRNWNTDVPIAQFFTSFTGAFPVFKTVNDMKNGTSAGTCGQFLPGYAPGTITDNSITQTEINDYSTNYNYYYGSGDGSGSGGSGGSGDSSGGFLDGLLDFLDSILDGILEILGRLLSALGDAISLIVDTFLDITDLFNGGFVDFISAIFPFIPKEWITAITLALILSVLGVIIRIFIG